MPLPSSIKNLLHQGSKLLGEGSENPRLDAEILLGESLGKSREWMLAHSEESVSEELGEAFFRLISRRKNGEAVSEILGRKEFFGRDFFVNSCVLTPRPETEMIVEKALEVMTKKYVHRIIDIGTGSGCIAITIAKELEQKKSFPLDTGGFCGDESQSEKFKLEKYKSIQNSQKAIPEVFALDISDEALLVAKKNAKKHGVLEKISFQKSDLLSSFSPQDNDLFLANLPYIPESDTLPIEVQKGDPELALFSGEDGLDAYRRLFEDLAKRWDGLPFTIIFEFDPPQKEEFEALFQKLFGESGHWEFFRDLSGKWRIGVFFQ